MTNPGGSADQGARAEERVASIFRALGYRVERDRLLNGNQIDLVATTSVPGYGEVRLVVEVKYRSEGSVPKAEVLSFLNVAKSLIEAGQCTRAVLVSNHPFTRFSKEAVLDYPNLDLQTVDDLERTFLALEGPLKGFLERYRSDRVGKNYVDLHVTFIESEPPLLDAGPDITATGLYDIAVAEPHAAVLLFGDYGAGKSTSLERVKARAAEDWISRTSNLVPLLFLLKDFIPGTELDRFISDTFHREYGILIPPAVFWDLLEQGQFLLLLDGFDEVTLRADARVRAEVLSELSPLLFGSSPSIMTTRPSYFVSYAEYRQVLWKLRSAAGLRVGALPEGSAQTSSAQRLANRLRPRYGGDDLNRVFDASYISYELDLLSSKQVDQFLAKFADEFADRGVGSPREVRQFIDSVYDLSDLIQRPILLDMIVATVLAREIDIANTSVPFGPSNLYEAYTGLKLAVDWDKAASRRSFLTPDQRRDFAELCAWQMHKADVVDLGGPEVESTARHVALNASAPIETVLTDLRTCSFLTISKDARLRFVHKSFLEFFVARRLKGLIDRREYDDLSCVLSPEIQYFLGAFGFRDDKFYKSLVDLGNSAQVGALRANLPRSKRELAITNLRTALLYAREEVARAQWESVRISRLRRSQVAFSNSALSNVTFDNASVSRFRFSGCSLKVEIKSSSTIDNLEASRCRGEIRCPASRVVVLDDCHLDIALTAGSSDATAVKLAKSDLNLSIIGRLASTSWDVRRSAVSAKGASAAVSVSASRSLLLLTGLKPDRTRVVADESVLYVAAGHEATWCSPDLLKSAIIVTASAEPKRGDEAGVMRALGQQRMTSCLMLAQPEVPVSFLDGVQMSEVVLLGGRVDPRAVPLMTGCTGLLFVTLGLSARKASRSAKISLLSVTERHGLVRVFGEGPAMERLQRSMAAAVLRIVRESPRNFPKDEFASMLLEMGNQLRESFTAWPQFEARMMSAAAATWPGLVVGRKRSPRPGA